MIVGARRGLRVVALAVLLAVAVAADAVAGVPLARADDRVRVVVSTGILADLARRVGGDAVVVDSIVPTNGDPHSYEPKPSDAAVVARADVAFTNHLLLEEHAIIKLIDSNLPDGAIDVSLAESTERYGGRIIPLREDVGLDVLWLGLAVRGRGPSRSADVRLTVTDVTGPGDVFVYVTDTLGNPTRYVATDDGLDERDVVVLPPDAHTHVSWTFTEPGTYRLTVAATLDSSSAGGGAREPIADATFEFAVGRRAPDTQGRTLVGYGHTDIAVDLDRRVLFVRSDEYGSMEAGGVVFEVPERAGIEVPGDRRFAFLGRPGRRVHELPQAVLGKHVHGEIDPHLWQDVANAKAYVQLMADALIAARPSVRRTVERNRDRYLARLTALDRSVRETTARIPPERRSLVTTHDAFGYLAAAYGLTVAGFVVPHPGQEPSAAQVKRLREAIDDLAVPAVFVEPNLAARSSVLRRVAADRGVRVCRLYGDAFDDRVRTYVAMMRHNADELVRCLGPAAPARG